MCGILKGQPCPLHTLKIFSHSFVLLADGKASMSLIFVPFKIICLLFLMLLGFFFYGNSTVLFQCAYVWIFFFNLSGFMILKLWYSNIRIYVFPNSRKSSITISSTGLTLTLYYFLCELLVDKCWIFHLSLKIFFLSLFVRISEQYLLFFQL